MHLTRSISFGPRNQARSMERYTHLLRRIAADTHKCRVKFLISPTLAGAMKVPSLSNQETFSHWHRLPLEMKQHILHMLLDDCKQDHGLSGHTLHETIRNLASVGHSFTYDVLRQPLADTIMALRMRRQQVDPCVGQAPGLPPWLELSVDVVIDEARRSIWSIENREVRSCL